MQQKKKSFFRVLSLLLAMCLLGASVPLLANAAISGDFDPAFLDAIYDYCDGASITLDPIGSLSTSSFDAITTLDVSGKGLKSLDGIEHLNNLEKLYCSNNDIAFVNVSYLPDDDLGVVLDFKCNPLSPAMIAALAAKYTTNATVLQDNTWAFVAADAISPAIPTSISTEKNIDTILAGIAVSTSGATFTDIEWSYIGSGVTIAADGSLAVTDSSGKGTIAVTGKVINGAAYGYNVTPQDKIFSATVTVYDKAKLPADVKYVKEVTLVSEIVNLRSADYINILPGGCPFGLNDISWTMENQGSTGAIFSDILATIVALSPGSAQLTATFPAVDGVAASYNVIITFSEFTEVTGIALRDGVDEELVLPAANATAISWVAGKNYQLPAIADLVVEPSNATYQDIEWRVTAGSAATVDPVTGLVTSTATGAATISAVVDNGKAMGTAYLHEIKFNFITPPLSSVKAQENFTPGKDLVLEAHFNPETSRSYYDLEDISFELSATGNPASANIVADTTNHIYTLQTPGLTVGAIVYVDITIKNGAGPGVDKTFYDVPIIGEVKSVTNVKVTPNNFVVQTKAGAQLGIELVPEDPSTTTIEWSWEDPYTGPTLTGDQKLGEGNITVNSNGVFSADAPGVYNVVATIVGGVWNGTGYEDFRKVVAWVDVQNKPVEEIIVEIPNDVAKTMVPLDLTGQGLVEPFDATNSEISGYYLDNGSGAPGAPLMNNVFTPTAAGTYTLWARVEGGGIYGEDVDRSFTVVVTDVNVQRIDNVPSAVPPNTPLDLFASNIAAYPANATAIVKGKTITWKLISQDGVVWADPETELADGDDITGPITLGIAPGFSKGTIEVEATIIDGLGTAPFTKEFTISISGKPVTSTKYDTDPASPAGTTLYKTETNVPLNFVATILPADANVQQITWTVEDKNGNTIADPSIAKVEYDPDNSKTVKFTASVAGNYNLVAFLAAADPWGKDITDKLPIEVKDKAITSFTLVATPGATSTAPVAAGTEVTLDFELPSGVDGTGISVNWFIYDNGGAIDLANNAPLLDAKLTPKRYGMIRVGGTLVGATVTVGQTQYIDIYVKNIPATELDAPDLTAYVNEPLTIDLADFTATAVAPAVASVDKVTGVRVKEDNKTGATLSPLAADGTYTLTPSRIGENTNTITMLAIIAGGSETGTEQTIEFTIKVRHREADGVTAGPFRAIVDQPLTLTGKVTPPTATDQNIVWSIDPGNLLEDAKVTKGVFLSPTVGKTKVVATVLGATALGGQRSFEFEIIVDPIPVRNISEVPATAATNKHVSLDPKDIIMIPSSADKGFTSANIVWSVADPSKCKFENYVDTDGVTKKGFVASAPGTYTIRATVAKGGGWDATLNAGAGDYADFTETYDIVVTNTPVQSIKNVPTYAKPGVITDLGAVATISPPDATANEFPSDPKIEWTIDEDSEADAIARGITLSLDGKLNLEGVADGSVTVVATIKNATATGGTIKKTYVIYIADSDKNITLTLTNPSNGILTSGVELKLAAEMDVDDTDLTIVWEMFDAGNTNATIDGDKIIAPKPGKLTIRATILGGLYNGDDHYTYFDLESVASPITVTVGGKTGATGSVTVNVRKTAQIVINNANGPVRYASYDQSIVSVSASGEITGKKPGTTTIHVITETDQLTTVEVTVKYNFWQWLLVIFLFGFLWVPLK